MRFDFPLKIIGEVVDPRLSVLTKYTDKPPIFTRYFICPLNVYTEDVCILPFKDRYRLNNDPDVYYCAWSNQWQVRSRLTIKLLRANKPDCEVQFDPNIFPLIYENASNIYALESIEMATKLGYVPACNSTTLWIKASGTKKPTASDTLLRATSQYSSTTLEHKIRNNGSADAIARHVSNLPIPEISGILATYSKVLSEYKFGIEFEVSRVADMPSAYCGDLGLVRLKDGSLPDSGAEFATIPMAGAKGIQLVDRIIDKLASCCDININCALHVHISGFNFNPNFAVAVYYLYYRLQDEILSFLPHYLQNTVAIARKSKIYADRLPNLGFQTKNVNLIQERIAAYYRGTSKKTKVLGWEDKSWINPGRYSALNMANIFADGSTIEFRIHPPSLSKERIFNWLMLTLLIIRVAEENTEFILNCMSSRDKLSLSDVVNSLRYKNYKLNTEVITDEEDLAELATSLLQYIGREMSERQAEEVEAINRSSLKGQEGKFDWYRKIAKRTFASESASRQISDTDSISDLMDRAFYTNNTSQRFRD